VKRLKLTLSVLLPLLLLDAAPALASSDSMKETYLGIPAWIWLAANLLLFVFLLARFIGKPLGAFLESRAASITAELADARRKVAEAQELTGQANARLAQMETEVAALKERAAKEAEAEVARISEQAKAEEARLLKRVEDEITRRTNETRKTLAAETAALTAQMAQDLLAKQTTDADRKRVLERSLEAMRTVET
jgi:F-type H+-transporting ATPase subunit b